MYLFKNSLFIFLLKYFYWKYVKVHLYIEKIWKSKKKQENERF